MSRFPYYLAVGILLAAINSGGCNLPGWLPSILPGPVVVASPLPDPGLHVAVIYEKDDLQRYTQEHRDLFVGAWRKTATDAGGQWRLLDDDALFNTPDNPWSRALALPRTELPWVVVSNAPKGGFSGPLPEDCDALCEIIQHWAAR